MNLVVLGQILDVDDGHEKKYSSYFLACYNGGVRKYWTIYLVSITESMNRRAEMLIYIIQDFIGPLLSILLWLGVVGYAGSIQAGWDSGRIVAYFLTITFLTLAVNHYIDTEIGYKHIAQGELANHIVKPMAYYLYVFLTETGWKTVRLGVSLFPFGFFLLLFQNYLHISVAPRQVAMAVIYSIIAYLLIFFYKFLIALTAFWVTDHSGFVHAFWGFNAVFAGRLIPFDFLPDWLQRVSWWLPFRFFFYVPANTLLSPESGSSMLINITISGAWLMILVIANMWMFRRGLQRFSDTR